MKRTIILVVSALLVAGSIFFSHIAGAEVEWKIVKDLDLKTTPLDIAPSLDGKWLYILTPGEILVYSFSVGTITDRIPVDKGFDKIASLPRADTLVISSSAKKAVQIVLLEPLYKIDVTGSPFRGPQDAPVTLVVFDDYQ